MKKLLSMFLSVMMLFLFPFSAASENEQTWESEYARIINQITLKEQTKYILADLDYDDVPELIAGDNGWVSVFTFKNNSVIKISDNKEISIQYFENLKAAGNNQTNLTEFIGQVADGSDIITYKINFSDSLPLPNVVAVEHGDNTGIFKGDEETSQNVPNCTALVKEYLSKFSLKPITLCVLSAKEVDAADTEEAAIESLFGRYRFLSTLSDDTSDFSKQQRESVKKAVGEGLFFSFDKISRLNDTDVFVQFYVNDVAAPAFSLPYAKQYAVVTNAESAPNTTVICRHESELDTAYLSELKTRENEASNVYIDYGKTRSFRGIDDYVNYFSNLLSSSGKDANENGKKAVSEYMEHAVNRSSRTEIKAKNNVVTVNDYAVSFIAQNAAECMERLVKLCESQDFSPIRKARTIPELVCSGLNLSEPVRIEYEHGISQTLSDVSGIRLMLDESHGIYITASDLAILENSFDMFCIEFKKSGNTFSVVFTDRNNQTIEYINAPVWFIVPAENEYSTVMASFKGGTDNWGGQFDPKNKTIEFSTNYSGDYDIVENDITINDIDTMPSDTKEAIRFMVSKGIFTPDKHNRFKPNDTLSRYDFTAALVKMFYATNVDAQSAFSDVPESSEFYRYVASAEELNIAEGYADGTFRGNEPVSKEQVVTLCGRTLAEKKEYAYSENSDAYLNFTDADQISLWARPDIAIAAQCGLVSNIGIFSPAGAVTRAEGAEILYKTFMLLYDVSPVTTVSSLVEAESSPQNAPEIFDFEFRAAICIIITIVLLFVFYIFTKLYKKRKIKKRF